MTIRTLARILLGAGAVGGLAVLAACSSAPQEASQSNDEQLVVCAPPMYRVCSDPGEGLHGTTVCGCARASQSGLESCGAYGAVPVPPALDSRCLAGTNISGSNVWSCPADVVVPQQIFTPPSDSYETIQKWVPASTLPDGGTPCTGNFSWCGTCYFSAGAADYCVGVLPPGRVYIVETIYPKKIIIGSGCTGLCGLCGQIGG